MDTGKFKEEIVPVSVKDARGRVAVVMADEAPRRDTSLEALAQLKPAFSPHGRVTAGNAPGLNDAAAALVVASAAKARELGVQPLARIAGYAQAAVEPKYIFDAPAKAIPRLLDKVGWTLAEVDLIEINEAFAAQMLANGHALADLGWDWHKVNVHGGGDCPGASAWGHGGTPAHDPALCAARSPFGTRHRLSVPWRWRGGGAGRRERSRGVNITNTLIGPSLRVRDGTYEALSTTTTCTGRYRPLANPRGRLLLRRHR